MPNLEFRKTQVTYLTNIEFTETYEKIIQLQDELGLLKIIAYPAEQQGTGSKGSLVFIFNSVDSCKIQLSVKGTVTFSAYSFDDFIKAKTILNGIAIITNGKNNGKNVVWNFKGCNLKPLQKDLLSLVSFRVKLFGHLEHERIEEMSWDEIAKLGYVKNPNPERMSLQQLKLRHCMNYSLNKTMGLIEQIINSYWSSGEGITLNWSLRPV